MKPSTSAVTVNVIQTPLVVPLDFESVAAALVGCVVHVVLFDHDDVTRLVDACLRSPDLEYAVVYGISANTRGWWDLEPGRALGYEPADDAETFAKEVFAAHEALPGDDAESAFVGGRWTTFSNS